MYDNLSEVVIFLWQGFVQKSNVIYFVDGFFMGLLKGLKLLVVFVCWQDFYIFDCIRYVVCGKYFFVFYIFLSVGFGIEFIVGVICFCVFMYMFFLMLWYCFF